MESSSGRRRLDHNRVYEFRFREIDQTARQAVWNEIATFLWNKMGRPDPVLDPAGGLGEFLNGIPTGERWLVDVVDFPGRDVNRDVKVVIGDIFDVELPSNYFAGVFASNLLEHFPTPDAVAAFLIRMREVLIPGGILAIMGPNFKYCAGEYFDCADHTLALTHVAVAEHLYAAGFEIVELHPRFLPYSFRSALPASPRLTRAYLRTPALWRVLGKQFLALART
jgi:SAM-dependent methyltransferase